MGQQLNSDKLSYRLMSSVRLMQATHRKCHTRFCAHRHRHHGCKPESQRAKPGGGLSPGDAPTPWQLQLFSCLRVPIADCPLHTNAR